MRSAADESERRHYEALARGYDKGRLWRSANVFKIGGVAARSKEGRAREGKPSRTAGGRAAGTANATTCAVGHQVSFF